MSALPSTPGVAAAASSAGVAADAASSAAALAAAANRRRWVVGLSVAAAIGLVVLPFLFKNYRVFQFNLVIVYAVAILGLNILTGYNGQISLGHSAFYAVGAYTAAILMDKLGVPYWATLPVAGVVSFVIGFLLGFPALRLAGHYLALATFALALAVPQLLKFKKIEHLTGGVQGIVLNKPEAPFSFSFLGQPLSADRWLYFFSLAVAVLMFWGAWNLLHGRVGRALIAIRDHPIAASAMGINLPVFKSITFGVSAAYTGVAGALGAVVVAFVSPDSFTVSLSIFLLVGVVVGGLASIPGAIFGAIFIQFVPNIADQLSKSAPAAIYGVLLIGLMYLMPTGVMGGLQTLWRRLMAARKGAAAQAPSGGGEAARR